MRRLLLAGLAALTLSACADQGPVGQPLIGAGLEAKLGGQLLSMTPDYPEMGMPTLARLYVDGTVDLDYARPDPVTLRWRVEGQGLCFSSRNDADRFTCRNVVATPNSDRVTIYQADLFTSDRIGVGTLTPL